MSFATPCYSTDKLLQQSDITYIGSFRVPKTDMGGPLYQGLSYGGSIITYNPVNNSLFVTGNDANQQVGEISIPAIINSTDINALNTATVIQNLVDITEGNRDKIAAGRSDCKISKSQTGDCYGNGSKIGGLLKYGSSLIGSVYAYYDGGASAIYTHFRSGTTTATNGDFEGMFEVGAKPSPVPQAGFVGGYMTTIPSNWQVALGGKVLTGMGNLSVLGRTSSGPALFSFDPNDFGMSTPAPASALLYYNLTSSNCVNTGTDAGGDVCDNQNIGSYYTSTTLYKAGSHLSGVVFPSGSKSVIITGKYGTGTSCYGYGNTNGTAGGGPRTTNVPKTEMVSWMNTNGATDYPCGTGSIPSTYLEGNSHQCCYDPSNANPGAHAFPYVPYAWAYDADDLARVKSGGRIVDNPSPNLVTAIIENGVILRPGVSPASTETYKPWHIKPYASWTIPSPFTQEGYSISSGASAYDETIKTLYVAQVEADDSWPIINAYRVDLTTTQGGRYKNYRLVDN